MWLLLCLLSKAHGLFAFPLKPVNETVKLFKSKGGKSLSWQKLRLIMQWLSCHWHPFQFLAYIRRILIVEGNPSSEQHRKKRNLFFVCWQMKEACFYRNSLCKFYTWWLSALNQGGRNKMAECYLSNKITSQLGNVMW